MSWVKLFAIVRSVDGESCALCHESEGTTVYSCYNIGDNGRTCFATYHIMDKKYDLLFFKKNCTCWKIGVV